MVEPSTGVAHTSRRAPLLVAAAVALAIVVVIGAWLRTDRSSSERSSSGPIDSGVVTFEGVSIEPDGRALVVSFIGAADGRAPDDPCWEGYRSEVSESSSSVRIVVHRQRASDPVYPAGVNSDIYDCTMAGFLRTVRIDLAQPLGSRAVVDGTDGTVKDRFDRETLLTPTWLPEGMSGGDAGGSGACWTQQWDSDAVNAYVSIGQCAGAGDPSNDALVEERTVRGVPAAIYTQGDNHLLLVWDEGGQHIVLRSGPVMHPGPGLTVDDLVRVAEGLEPPPI